MANVDMVAQRLNAHRADLAQLDRRVSQIMDEISSATDTAASTLAEYQGAKAESAKLLEQVSGQYRQVRLLLGQIAELAEPLTAARQEHIRLTNDVGVVLQTDPARAQDLLGDLETTRELFKTAAGKIKEAWSDYHRWEAGPEQDRESREVTADL